MADTALEKGLFNWTLFAAHQAVEKALNVFVIVKKHERPTRIHELVGLLKLLQINTEDEIVSTISKLSPYYFIDRL